MLTFTNSLENQLSPTRTYCRKSIQFSMSTVTAIMACFEDVKILQTTYWESCTCPSMDLSNGKLLVGRFHELVNGNHTCCKRLDTHSRFTMIVVCYPRSEKQPLRSFRSRDNKLNWPWSAKSWDSPTNPLTPFSGPVCWLCVIYMMIIDTPISDN